MVHGEETQEDLQQMIEEAFSRLESKLKSKRYVCVIEKDKNQKIQREGIIKNYQIDKKSGKVSILADGYFSDEGYRSGNILEDADILDIEELEEIQNAKLLSDEKSIEICTYSEIKVKEQNTKTKKEIKDMLENMYTLEDRYNTHLDSRAPFEMMDLLEQADKMHLEECPWTFEIYEKEINISEYVRELKKRYSPENYFDDEFFSDKENTNKDSPDTGTNYCDGTIEDY
ncbi:MAG: hypothetical protein QW666_00075 [Candidatus Woesearchaeota archaeon]